MDSNRRTVFRTRLRQITIYANRVCYDQPSSPSEIILADALAELAVVVEDVLNELTDE